MKKGPLLFTLFLTLKLYSVDPLIGPSCPLNGALANLYSLQMQIVAPGQSPLFEQTNIETEAINLSIAESTGWIIFNEPGFYTIRWSITAPSFTLMIDHQLIQANQSNSTVTLFIDRGQIVRLINQSDIPVELTSHSSTACTASLCIARI